MLALILVAVGVGFSNLAASIGLGARGVDMATRIRVAVIFGLLEAGMPVLGLLIGHGLAAEVGRETRWLAAGLLGVVGGYTIVSAARRGELPRIGSRRAGTGAEVGGAPPAGTGAEVGGAPPTGTGAEVGGAPPAGTGAEVGGAPPAGSGAEVGGAPPTGTGAAGSARRDSGREIVRLLVTGFALSLDNLAVGFALGTYRVSVLAGVVVFGVVSTVMSLAGLEFGGLIGDRVGGGELIGGAFLVGVGVAIGTGALG